MLCFIYMTPAQIAIIICVSALMLAAWLYDRRHIAPRLSRDEKAAEDLENSAW
jgi:hypothetical protein